MPPDPQQLVRGYTRVTQSVRARVLRFVEATWAQLGEYRDDDIERFVATIVPLVAGAKMQLAALTDTYLATLEAQVLGTRVAPVGVSPASVSTQALRGISEEDLYRRAGVTVWTALSEGNGITFATAEGLRRATNLATTELQLARTHTARQVLAGKARVVGYRRVLTGSHSCDLCIASSQRRYHKTNLLPIHHGCDCAVAPIYGHHDPGQTINRGYAKPNTDPTLPAAQLVVHEHGELGPVLAVRGHDFTGPHDF